MHVPSSTSIPLTPKWWLWSFVVWILRSFSVNSDCYKLDIMINLIESVTSQYSCINDLSVLVLQKQCSFSTCVAVSVILQYLHTTILWLFSNCISVSRTIQLLYWSVRDHSKLASSLLHLWPFSTFILLPVTVQYLYSSTCDRSVFILQVYTDWVPWCTWTWLTTVYVTMPTSFPCRNSTNSDM